MANSNDEQTVKVRDNDIILVGWEYNPEKNTCFLTVGRRAPGDTAELINVFQGREALELYAKLTNANGSGVTPVD